MKNVFLVLSIVLPIYSPIPYIRSILAGITKPHRTTRLVYFVIGILTTLALFASGDRIALWISAVSTLQAIVLFYLGIMHGIGGWTKKDILCLILALSGIVLWQTTNNPIMGLYFGIAADFAGTIPTIIKTYHLPETENWQFYALDTLAGICNMLALSSFTPAAYSYPLYLILVNGLITLLAISKLASQGDPLRG